MTPTYERRKPARRSSSLAGAALLVGVVALGFGLRASFSEVPVRTSDEAMYARSAEYMFKNGKTIADVVRVYNETPDAWQHPSPTRIGHLLLVYQLVAVTGDGSIPNVTRLSFAASVVSLLILGVLAWVRFGPWVAAMAVAFLACSPLDLAISRRAWQDAVVAAFTLSSIGAYAGAMLQPPRRAWWVAFFALSGFTVLVKESAVLILGLGALGLAWTAWRERRRLRDAWPPLLLGIATLAAALALQAMVCGGVQPLIESYGRLLGSPRVNDYMRQYQLGGPELYWRGLGLLQPVPWALGALGALLVAARAPFVLAPWNPFGRDLLTSLAWLVIVFGVTALVYSQKNMRFLSPIYAPVALLAAALLWAALEWLNARGLGKAWRVAAVALALWIAISGLGDVQRFRYWFVERGVPDLATPWFIER